MKKTTTAKHNLIDPEVHELCNHRVYILWDGFPPWGSIFMFPIKTLIMFIKMSVTCRLPSPPEIWSKVRINLLTLNKNDPL